MDEVERERVVIVPTKQKVSYFTYLGDFFNTLKAFIGTNYLALAFAFSNSGAIFGIVGVFLIATLTDYCCQLLIKCKYIIIDRLVDEDTASRPLSAFELTALRQKLERSIGYGDVGRLAFGRWCEVLINLIVVFTQFLTTVCYFVFIGNAIFTVFPMVPAMTPFNGSSVPVINETRMDSMVNGVPLLSISNIGKDCSQRYQCHSRQRRSLDWDPTDVDDPIVFGLYDDVWGNDTTTSAPITNVTTEPAGNTTTAPKPTTPIPSPRPYEQSTAPNLMYLVMIPLPIFLCTSLIRKLRFLSPITVVATFSLFVGAIAVLAYLCVGFTINDNFQWIKFETLPIFIGQLTSSYEGIGCVLPIESSMEGSRHLFPLFLHLAVYLVFLILTAFGLIGYLRYGNNVQQLIILSMPQHSWLSIAINMTLIVSVVCTFPLQMFPTIQIAESFFFGPGKCCAPPPPGLVIDDDHGPLINEDPQGALEQSTDSFVSSGGQEVAVEIPNLVPAWKRNMLRIMITLLAMGCGILLRNVFAYVGAFSGAVGCSILAFVLPCAIHLQLKRQELHILRIILDLCIIFLSAVCSILVLVIIAYKMATHAEF